MPIDIGYEQFLIYAEIYLKHSTKTVKILNVSNKENNFNVKKEL